MSIVKETWEPIQIGEVRQALGDKSKWRVIGRTDKKPDHDRFGEGQAWIMEQIKNGKPQPRSTWHEFYVSGWKPLYIESLQCAECDAPIRGVDYLCEGCRSGK
jgi:hypothetical protein